MSKNCNIFLNSGFVLLATLAWANLTQAQEANDGAGSDQDLEQLYERFEKEEPEVTSPSLQEPARGLPAKEPSGEYKLSDLSSLAPYSDVATIHRRFLPKTFRLEASLSGLVGLNNAFFNNLGGVARLGFAFNEEYSIEADYFLLSQSQRTVTQNLRKNRNIKTESLVVAKNYMGANLKWTPIYGKTALFDKKIVPFDIYFLAGFGNTETEVDSANPTINLGVGQIFAISKTFAIRWDFSLHSYQAKVSNTDNSKSTKSQNDLFVGVGISAFIPEAKYR